MKNIFSKKQTDLDLNGPNLSFTTQPSSITGIGTTVGGSQGANVSITGVSTANFNYGGDSEESPTPFNRGEIKYQWYEEGVGKLSDDSSTTGTGTTTLTVSNLITPTDNGRKFFLAADYEPLTPVLTGNAPNEPLNSGIATVTVTPLVEVTTQPALTSTFPNVATNISVVAGLSDDSFGDDTQYQWQLDGSDVSDGTITKSSVDTIVAGSTTSTLTLTSDNSGIGYVVRCVISSANASNSPIISDSQIYTVQATADFNNVNIESIPNGSAIATLSNFDLNDGEITLNAATTSTATDFFLYSLYAPDKDVDVEMELYGGKGNNFGDMGTTGRAGGMGGFSRIRFTMKQNEEYVIAGLTESINTPFVYRKGVLIACVGQGGAGGQSGGGGSGGGVNVDGQAGNGAGSSTGNSRPLTGSLTIQGTFGSAFQSPTLYPGDVQEPSSSVNGGQTISCTKGVYYAQKGVGPCVDVGVNGDAGFMAYFRLSDGTIVTNTALIERGYKAGYNIIQTAGINQTSNSGKGGNGATGGNGGITLGGGAGGSGYTDGSLTEVVYTQQGGGSENGKIILRVVN